MLADLFGLDLIILCVPLLVVALIVWAIVHRSATRHQRSSLPSQSTSPPPRSPYGN